VPTPARSINSSSSSSSKDPPTHVPPAPPTHGIQAAARTPLPMCPQPPPPPYTRHTGRQSKTQSTERIAQQQ
jgi:hypothetical protein